MEKVPVSKIQEICKKNQPTEETYYTAVRCPSIGFLIFNIEWFYEKNGFVARPVHIQDDGEIWLIRINIDESIRRFLKQYFRKEYRIRHIAEVNQPNNERDIQRILGIQTVSPKTRL